MHYKNLLLIFLLCTTKNLIAQSFPISTEMLFLENSSESWLRTLIDATPTTYEGKDYYKWKVENSFYGYKEQYLLNETNEISIIIRQFTRNFRDLFPYVFPDIKSIYETIGEPDEVTIGKKIPFPGAQDGNKFLEFEKYYKWNRVGYRNNISSYEIGIATLKELVFKNGKYRKTKNIETTGIQIYRALEELPKTSPVDIILSGIAKGIIKKTNETKYKSLQLMGKEKFNDLKENTPFWLTPFLLPSDLENPKDYISNFFFFGAAFYGMNEEPYITDVKVTFTLLPGNTIAKANGMNEDCCIDISIDLENWEKSSLQDKIFIIYHELAHDAYNIEHSSGIRIMSTTKLDEQDPENLGEMIHELYLEILNTYKK